MIIFWDIDTSNGIIFALMQGDQIALQICAKTNKG
jgi:hypothetical protein